MTKQQALSMARQHMKKSFELAEEYNGWVLKNNKFARRINGRATLAAKLADKYFTIAATS